MSFVVRGYGRASTDGQVLSTTQQEAVVHDAFGAYQKIKPAWADAVWGGFFADEATGRTSCFHERNAGSLLLAACQPGDVIVVSNYDRIFARVVDVCDTLDLLKARNIGLIVLDCEIDTTTILGAFVYKLLALVKELEVHEIRRRTRESKDHRKRIGRPHTYPTCGWKIIEVMVPGVSGAQKYFVPDNAARRLAREIMNVKIMLEGGYERARVYCNANNILRRNRRKWTKRTFQKWCDAAFKNFPLHNGSHDPAPIPANAIPVGTNTISPED